MIKLYQYFKKSIPYFKNIGVKNLWIIKPALNSKGQGISIVNTLDEAIE